MDAILDALQGFFPSSTHQQTTSLVLTAAASLALGLSLQKLSFNGNDSSSDLSSKIIPSPRRTLLPYLTQGEIDSLSYPPDLYPGGRYVASPYGTLRVWEWGPEDGKKVLLIHGISVPTLSVGAIAQKLVEKGCRVMLFDNFGRGWSDTPSDIPFDNRLYTTAILLALTSSPLAWTSASPSSKFSIVGYSLGGGIVAGFASYFVHMLDSIILLCPSGLIRQQFLSNPALTLWAWGLVPRALMEWAVGYKLRTREDMKEEQHNQDSKPRTKQEQNGYANGHANGSETKRSRYPLPLSSAYPGLTVPGTTLFQLRYHQGFLRAMSSSLFNSPLSNQHVDWQRLGSHLTAQNESTYKKHPDDCWIRHGKVLIIGGEDDVLILKKELVEDAEADLKKGNVEFRFVPGVGHQLPFMKPEETVKEILAWWGVE